MTNYNKYFLGIILFIIPFCSNLIYSQHKDNSEVLSNLVKLSVGLPNGKFAKITVYENDMATVEINGHKIGITPDIKDKEKNKVLLKFWQITENKDEKSVIFVNELESNVGSTIISTMTNPSIEVKVEKILEILSFQE